MSVRAAPLATRGGQGSATLKSCLLLAAMMILPSIASAFDRAPEATAFAYLELPLGASRADSGATLGFRFYAPASQADSFTGLVRERPPLADLKFTRRGFAGVYINGVNIALPVVVVRAAEESGGAAEINWLIVGGMVAIGAIGIVESNRRSDPPPQSESTPAAAACPPVFPVPPAPGLPPAPAPAC